MASDKNCSMCSYSEKQGENLWCRFHDEPVTQRNVCNSFLSFLDAPVMNELLRDVYGENVKAPDSKPKPMAGVIIKDICALLIGGLIIVAGVCVFLYF